jgi:hypothetical protein
VSDLTPNNYVNIIARLKEKIRQAKTKASLAVNKELLCETERTTHLKLDRQTIINRVS